MTMASILLACAASSATAAGLTYLYFRSRLSEARASANLFKEWWIRDSGEMLVLQAERDLRRQQHIDAGKQSHKAEREHIRETTDWLSSLPPQPLRPRHEIEAEVAAIRAARKSTNPPIASPKPAMGIPAAPSAGSLKSGTGEASRSVGQDIGRGHPPHVTPRASAGNEPGESCRRNRAGYSAPAEITPKAKGA